jgi:hypothetical protein
MEPTITLTLTVREADLLIKGLSKLPLEESLSLFAKIKEEAQKQLNPQPETPTVEEKKD